MSYLSISYTISNNMADARTSEVKTIALHFLVVS